MLSFVRKYGFILIIACIAAGCSGGNDIENIIRDQAMSEAGRYALGQLTTSESDTSGTGLVVYGDSVKRIIVDPSRLFTGQIDEDSEPDAIITIISIDNGLPGKIEHLIMLNTGSGLSMARSVESDMRILQLENRVITADLPTYPRSSPLYNCDECRELVKYSFKNGDLVRME